MAYAPAIPDTTATIRSSRFGCVRASTSAVALASGEISVAMIAMKIEASTPWKIARRPLRMMLMSPVTIPTASATNGESSGATSMAPIMTAGLLSSSPSVAIMADAAISTK